MLKALELIGFKSFADKTRLEFPRGVTVVVGPNGSGKSNIVDAIKWVLGEQSVKSLRGKEMVDVIFNGSSSRKPQNSAEVTLTFDNTDRRLPVDSDEVHFTRRVYRSGEGEYLLNRQACRLRDLRDLWAGTGVATEAYSIIEQGKVDVMLQSSPRERRLIFEEAAGISRFKAKKLEAQRRLERIDQNLLRLGDIVEEVESRLRHVRMQATKALKYKEYSDRLQSLRTQVGLTDWRNMTEKLTSLEQELEAAQDEVNATTAQADGLDAQALSLEAQSATAEETLRLNERQNTQQRERLTALEVAIEHEHQRKQQRDEEIARLRRQWLAMIQRAGDIEQQSTEVAKRMRTVEEQHRTLANQLASEERRLTTVTLQLDQQRTEHEQHRAEHVQQLKAAGTLGKQMSGLEATVRTTATVQSRGQQRVQELESARQGVSQQLTAADEIVASYQVQLQASSSQIATLKEQTAQARHQLAQVEQELAGLRQRHTVASQRAQLLEELERRLEGVSAGAKQILQEARNQPNGPFAAVRGMVADLLQVNVETAPLIEAALGELSQHLVVTSSDDLLPHLREHSAELNGRVGFIRMDVLPFRWNQDEIDLTGQPGVLGRADRFVETAPEDAVLARRLLGRTWLVETLPQALALQETTARGLCLVTLAGEVVQGDGGIVVGSRHLAAGLISRRSELRQLRQQLSDVQTKLSQTADQQQEFEAAALTLESQLQTAHFEHESHVSALAQAQLKAESARQKQEQLQQQLQSVQSELAAAMQEHTQAASDLVAAQEQMTRTTQLITELETRLDQGTVQIRQLEQTRQVHSRETNAAKVEVAKSEQELAGLKVQEAQARRDQQERQRALAECVASLEEAVAHAAQLDREILSYSSESARLYLHKERFTEETARIHTLRQSYREQRQAATQEASRIRTRLRKLETRLHTKQLAAEQLRLERGTLCERMRDDYGIDLAQAEALETAEDSRQRGEIDAEIADLRSKLNSIGGVNLDALTELEELEERYTTLSSQHQDLTSAKHSLEQIIHKINADSRKLFIDTLAVIKEHFQSLFRKLFGGGQADVVIEEGVDILESGIEIVARPPGKEPRSISLLSGGEKTLTCVALLLAIFRSRPSPFCVLDEVDAALDEANIERFVGVLKEFLAWTQFVVVTHSKKTMTCADTLYGITMQESGISKRVAVRFEEVSDNGEILNLRDEPQSDIEAA